MSSSNVVFSLTDAQVHFASVFAQSCTIPGTCVCFLVLIVYGITACFPTSRQHMDRVSFRLLIYALIFHVLFGIAYAGAPTSPGTRCDFAAFCSNLFLCFSTFFTTCIAINLQLVVVHHVNGQQMEKYYLIASTLLGIVLNVPTFALNQFGWDGSSSVCWYKNPDRIDRLRWMVATESFPVALAAIIETVCSCILLVYMFLVQRSIKVFQVSLPFTTSSTRPTTKVTGLKHIETQRRSMDITQNSRYRKAVLRIVLYPIISLLVNFSTVALDLNDFSLVGMRTLPYGLLAAFDSAFTNAVRELLRKNRSTSDKVPTMVPIEFAENSQISLRYPQGTTFGAEARSCLNIELTLLERGRESSLVEEGMNEDGEQRLAGVENMGQEDLASNNQCDLEFQRQL